jgi:hypothetical protein
MSHKVKHVPEDDCQIEGWHSRRICGLEVDNEILGAPDDEFDWGDDTDYDYSAEHDAWAERVAQEHGR